MVKRLLEKAIIEKPNNDDASLLLIYHIIQSVHDILAGENPNKNIKIFNTYIQSLHALNLDFNFTPDISLMCSNLVKSMAHISNEIQSLEVYPNNEKMKEELKYDISNFMFYVVHWNFYINNLNDKVDNENTNQN